MGSRSSGKSPLSMRVSAGCVGLGDLCTSSRPGSRRLCERADAEAGRKDEKERAIRDSSRANGALQAEGLSSIRVSRRPL
eukprot:2947688-Pleurochrysis_carterae.AAC.5